MTKNMLHSPSLPAQGFRAASHRYGRHHDATVDGQHDHDGRAGHGEHERHGFQHLDIFAVEAAIEVVDEAREEKQFNSYILCVRFFSF